MVQGKKEKGKRKKGKKKKGKEEDPEINKVDVLVLLREPPLTLPAEAAESYHWSNTASFGKVKRDRRKGLEDELVKQVLRYVVSYMRSQSYIETVCQP